MVITSPEGQQVSLNKIREPNNQDLNDVLQGLVRQQQQIDAGCSPIGKGNNLVIAEQSSPFLNFYIHAVRTFALPWFVPGERPEVNKRFRGAAFEAVGTSILQQEAQDKPEVTILDHERTLRLHEAMHPNSWRIPHLFGLDGLAHLYAPDAVEVTHFPKEPKITRAFDMKTGNHKMDWDEYNASVQNLRLMVPIFPDLFAPDASLEIICLAGSNKIGDISFGNRRTIRELPIEKHEFHKWVNQTYSQFRLNPESATLKEIQRRAMTQWEKATAVDPRKLTPEYMSYLRKISDPPGDIIVKGNSGSYNQGNRTKVSVLV